MLVKQNHQKMTCDGKSLLTSTTCCSKSVPKTEESCNAKDGHAENEKSHERKYPKRKWNVWEEHASVQYSKHGRATSLDLEGIDTKVYYAYICVRKNSEVSQCIEGCIFSLCFLSMAVAYW